MRLLDVLTLEQAREAYRFGLARSNDARQHRQVHRFDWQPADGEQREVDGQSAVAERFVSAALGLPWSSHELRPDDGTDVGGIYSVRWTRRRSGCLVLHDEDRDDAFGVLVVGQAPEQVLVGAIAVDLGRRREWWRDDVRHPAYFVPQRALEPIVRVAA